MKRTCRIDLNEIEGTVGQFMQMLEDLYPMDARLDIREEKRYGYGGWTDEDIRYIHVEWDE